jgi:3-deoxy-manno-octulosonate cytidylyltransferase (CMP-KDO synthetase)
MKIFIPARLGSTRLPNKPLLEVAGRPLIHWTIEAAKKVKGAEVHVLTEDQLIVEAVKDQCLVTFTPCFECGTDRVAWATRNFSLSCIPCIINWQADEPLIDPKHVEEIGNIVANSNIPIATLAARNRDSGLFDSNIAKVVVNKYNWAMYFSRAPIPWDGTNMLHHIGIYAFSRQFLVYDHDNLTRNWYKGERLEQVRWLENDHQIHVHQIETKSFGIDTPKDLDRLRALYAA